MSCDEAATREGRPRVKICGITSLEDALYAAECGADALGLVFYRKSPRYVSPDLARRIIGALPPMVTTFGLFVNHPPQEVLEIARFCGIDVLQLHGDELPEQCRFAPWRVVKALRLREQPCLQDLAEYRVSALLLDAWHPDSYGGTGQSFDWHMAIPLARQRPVILAGGLTPDNVAEAARTVRPYGVDVSSGVESSSGRKDPRRVAEFIRNAKQRME